MKIGNSLMKILDMKNIIALLHCTATISTFFRANKEHAIPTTSPITRAAPLPISGGNEIVKLGSILFTTSLVTLIGLEFTAIMALPNPNEIIMLMKFEIQIAPRINIAKPKPPRGMRAKAVLIALIIKNGNTKARTPLKIRLIE